MVNIIDEISDWKLEAKLENNDRYFFHSSEVKNIENGKKLFIIGRKGTGKTAIAHYLIKTSNHNTFTEKLSFKNFPFSELYKYNNDQFQPRGQYISIWKYIIYLYVCKMMIKNENIDARRRNELADIIGKKQLKDLRTTITSFVSASISILGTGGSINLKKDGPDSSLTIDQRVDIIENYILEHIDRNKYLIIFDELDEEYRGISENDCNYKYLITGLLKAVQDIRAIMQNHDILIYPIIFLRDDIYEFIIDNDRTKWRDLQVSLSWDENRIKQLLAFRISRAENKECTPVAFNTAWDKIFYDKHIRMGNRQQKAIPIFDYISRSTLLRPRDFINYLQCCCKMTQDKGHPKITANTVKESDKNFSEYMKQEFEDEVHPILPNINEIFRIISRIGKQTFAYNDFLHAYSCHFQRPECGGEAEAVLKLLFHFSIIGNVPLQNTAPPFFRYQSSGAWMNIRQPITMHRGLFKSLQII